jgi:DNA (cytosine-5)-methyltransferase 3A
MNVLSLFDGMSCAQIALERAGIDVDNYYASEVDKYAIAVTQHNYPDTIQIGDVAGINCYMLPEIDLLIGGSPCQGFSLAGKQLNFDDPRSKLFFEYVRLLEECSPKYFLLENVCIKKEYRDIITDILGVEPIKINSALVSAQSRKRLYWTNIPGVQQPEDKNIELNKVLFHLGHGFTKTGSRFYKKTPTVTTQFHNNYYPIEIDKVISYMNKRVKGGRTHWNFQHHSDVRNSDSSTVVVNRFRDVPYNVLKNWECIRKFCPVECERLQTVPDNYTLVPWKNRMMSNTQRYKMLGNGFTVDVIAHILRYMKEVKL